jgi:hypothetical protein
MLKPVLCATLGLTLLVSAPGALAQETMPMGGDMAIMSDTAMQMADTVMQMHDQMMEMCDPMMSMDVSMTSMCNKLMPMADTMMTMHADLMMMHEQMPLTMPMQSDESMSGTRFPAPVPEPPRVH